jgi:hypothetical protein
MEERPAEDPDVVGRGAATELEGDQDDASHIDE